MRICIQTLFYASTVLALGCAAPVDVQQSRQPAAILPSVNQSAVEGTVAPAVSQRVDEAVESDAVSAELVADLPLAETFPLDAPLTPASNSPPSLTTRPALVITSARPDSTPVPLAREDVLINVSHCAIQQPVLATDVTSAFFIVHKRGESPLSLVGAQAPTLTSQLELQHRVEENGGYYAQVMAACLLKEGDNWFRKDRDYLVLKGLQTPLSLGEIHPLTLVFDDGRTHTCSAIVRQASELTPKKPTYIYLKNGAPYQYRDQVTYLDY